MRTFDELMADARELGYRDTCNIVDMSRGERLTSDEVEAIYKVAHRAAMDRMEPALREAVEYLELNYRTMPYRGHGEKPEDCACAAHMAEEALEKIRALLAKEAG